LSFFQSQPIKIDAYHSLLSNNKQINLYSSKMSNTEPNGKTVVVLGAQFGDEGKGKLVYDLIKKFAQTGPVTCVRFNGGSNAGHTIVIDGVSYDTHLCPSGILHPNCYNVIGNGVFVNAMSLLKELTKFKSMGIEYERRLVISTNAHMTFMFHCLMDGLQNGGIGTTKQGMGPTAIDKVDRCGVRMNSLLSDDWELTISNAYSRCMRYYHGVSFEHEITYPEVKKFTSLLDMMNYEIEFIGSNLAQLRSMIGSTHYYLNDLPTMTSLVIEGANAIMLDTDFGTYPYVTSTACTIGNVMVGTGMSYKKFTSRNPEIIGVTKAYITRVGGGVLPTEDTTDVGDSMQRVGKEFGVTTKPEIPGHEIRLAAAQIVTKATK
jgi:adenylosuccinate synthase